MSYQVVILALEIIRKRDGSSSINVCIKAGTFSYTNYTRVADIERVYIKVFCIKRALIKGSCVTKGCF